MSRSQCFRDAELVLKHVRDWWRAADLGDRRVIAKDPLDDLQEKLIGKCGKLGMIHHERGRYVLEKITAKP